MNESKMVDGVAPLTGTWLLNSHDTNLDSHAHGAAGNLNWRTNNTLRHRFRVNSLDELTTVTIGGRLTVAGKHHQPGDECDYQPEPGVLK